MKRLFNRVDRVVEELLLGLVAVHPGLRKLPEHPVIVRADLDEFRQLGRVALISGGGSGHEPAHAGYVGRGMLTAAVAGDVFTSPPVDDVIAAIRAVAAPGSPGVVLLVKNYTGDRLNFGLAAEMARVEGIAVAMVLIADDVAIAPSDQTAGPRGVAGTVLVHKVAGAAAEAGATLTAVAAEARAAASSVATMGVALTPCTVPAAGVPGFTLAEDEVEIGLGIHGEPGIRRAPIEPADALIAHLLEPILAARLGAESRVALLVNGLGGTTPMELAIVARSALSQLAAAGLTVERTYVGTFLSALEMGGVSLSVLGLDDARLARLDAPTLAPAWPNAAPQVRIEPTATARIEPNVSPAQTNPIEPQTSSGQQLRAILVRAAHALIAQADHLTTLDQAVGDGDLGISLTRGARAVLAALPTWPTDDPAATLRLLADTLQRSIAGSSGPFYAVACLRAAVVFDDPSPNEPNPDRWIAALSAAIAGIEQLGGAQAGDRTMLDALIPALDAAAKTNPSLAAIARAARLGADATATMMPRRGRSSYLGDRALGHPDPGAVAVAVWLGALADPE